MVIDTETPQEKDVAIALINLQTILPQLRKRVLNFGKEFIEYETIIQDFKNKPFIETTKAIRMMDYFDGTKELLTNLTRNLPIVLQNQSILLDKQQQQYVKYMALIEKVDVISVIHLILRLVEQKHDRIEIQKIIGQKIPEEIYNKLLVTRDAEPLETRKIPTIPNAPTQDKILKFIWADQNVNKIISNKEISQTLEVAESAVSTAMKKFIRIEYLPEWYKGYRGYKINPS